MRKLSNNVDQNVLKIAYFALFHSKLLYGLEIWGNAASAYKLFLLQKKAVRIICNAKPRDSCKPMFFQLNILTLPAQYIYNCLVFIRKHSDNFDNHTSLHHYNTRKKEDLIVPFFNTKHSTYGPNYLGMKFCNKLSLDLRNQSLNTFKKTLYKYLSKECFYTYKEFLEASNAP